MDQRLGGSNRDLQVPPIPGGRGLSTRERQALDLADLIPGWGSDIDPARRPGVPRDAAPQIGSERLYPRITPQRARTTILKSTEHGQMPPVFGTSCPLHGLSGLIRRRAYRLSEGRLRRWIMLMTADRVDVIEGLLSDLAHLRLPNIPREMGLSAELRHNRNGFAVKVLGATTVAALLVWGLRALR